MVIFGLMDSDSEDETENLSRPEDLFSLCQRGDEKSLDDFLKKKPIAGLSQLRDSSGRSALQVAVDSDHIHLVQKLMDTGFTGINAKGTQLDGRLWPVHVLSLKIGFCWKYLLVLVQIWDGKMKMEAHFFI